MTMRALVRSFWLPKAGNSPEEYEDAFYPAIEGECSGNRIHFAVADGASEGMLSGQWAQILVRAFCRLNGTSAQMDTLLSRAYGAWGDWKTHYLQFREQQNRPIQWFEEPGLHRGAFSTLLGLTLIHGETSGRWEVVALGDSCVFQVRDEKLIAACPVTESSAFGSRPFLLASNPANNAGMSDHLTQAHHEWRSGDRFYLMTDALAQWFLRAYEAEQSPWQALHPASAIQPAGFEKWVQSLRVGHAMRNDDVTLISIEIG